MQLSTMKKTLIQNQNIFITLNVPSEFFIYDTKRTSTGNSNAARRAMVIPNVAVPVEQESLSR